MHGYHPQLQKEKDVREKLKLQLVKDKSELIHKNAIIAEYDYRAQELEDEIALLTSDLKHLNQDMADMQLDFDNETQALKSDLVNANNAMTTLENELTMQEKNHLEERTRLDNHWAKITTELKMDI